MPALTRRFHDLGNELIALRDFYQNPLHNLQVAEPRRSNKRICAVDVLACMWIDETRAVQPLCDVQPVIRARKNECRVAKIVSLGEPTAPITPQPLRNAKVAALARRQKRRCAICAALCLRGGAHCVDQPHDDVEVPAPRCDDQRRRAMNVALRGDATRVLCHQPLHQAQVALAACVQQRRRLRHLNCAGHGASEIPIVCETKNTPGPVPQVSKKFFALETDHT